MIMIRWWYDFQDEDDQAEYQDEDDQAEYQDKDDSDYVEA